MALSVVNNMTAFGTGDTGESIDVATGAGWYDLDNLHADFGRLSLISSITADYYEGASTVEGCVGISHATNATVIGMVYSDGSTTIDMSGTMFIRCTAKFGETSKMGTKAQGGIRLIVVDSGGDYKEWYVGGSDDYSGDWEQFLVDVSTTADNTSATAPTMTDITYFGISSYYVTKPARAENVYIDAQWYGSDPSITVTGTVTTAGDGWSELESLSQSVTTRYGVIRLRNGIYELRGVIKFNNTTTGSVDFSDDQNAKLRYVPAPVGSLDSVSEFLLQGNATGTTDFELGSLVGGAGLLGGTIFSPSVLFTFDSDTNAANIDSCNLYGVSFEGAGIILMDDPGTTQTMISCQLLGCKQFDPGAAAVSLSNFIDTSDTASALLWNTNIDISDSNFIANTTGAAIEVTDPTLPISLDNMKFPGNTYDMLNSGAAATITAGSFVVGRGYKILTVGTTDYTLIGAANNTIGTKFVATGVGAGTGTATEVLVVNLSNGSDASTSNNTGTNADHLFVADQRTLSFTVSPLPSPDYEWRLYTVTALGSLAGSSEINGAEFETSASKISIYTYTYAAGTYMGLQIISNNYVEEVDYFELEDNNMSRTINLTVNDND